MLRHDISREILTELLSELEHSNELTLDRQWLINRLRWLGHVIEQDELELGGPNREALDLQECKQRLITKLTKFAEEAMPFYRDAEQLKALMIDIMAEIDNVYRLGMEKRA
jgi:hypothetical protein